jgi:GMP synthase-like glutamine amidotransferase
LKSSEAPLRIGILRTDEVMPQFQADYGDYPDMFTRLLASAAETCSPPQCLELEFYDARQGEFPEPTNCNGYVITGSRHSVYDDEPWIEPLVDFLRQVIGVDRKVIGICFGHQLMAHFFGGRVEKAAAGWGVGVHSSCVVSEESWMVPSQDHLKLLSMHKDQVTEMPESARLLTTSEFCPIGGFAIGNQVMTLQGHPEFVKNYSRSLMEMRLELIGEPRFQSGMQSLSDATDEALVGQWMINFFLMSVE